MGILTVIFNRQILRYLGTDFRAVAGNLRLKSGESRESALGADEAQQVDRDGRTGHGRGEAWYG